MPNYGSYRGRLDYYGLYYPSTVASTIRTYLSGTNVFNIPFNQRAYPMMSANYMIDQHHVRRTRNDEYGVGRYPPGACFHLHADLSRWPLFYDYSLPPYNIVFDSTSYTRQAPISGDALAVLIGPYDSTDFLAQAFSQRIPSGLMNSLSEEAWNYFSDVLPAHLSFSEFVQGFTQLAALLPSVGESITKTISSGYLQKKFGWDNLVSDLNTCAGLVQTVLDRMDYFRRTYGIPQRLGFVRGLDCGPRWTTATIPSSLGYGYEFVLNVVNFRASYRATAWILQTLDYMRDLVGFLRVFVGALGLNNPVKAFWNTVPLSFVVDWFFNVSQHLDNLTRLNPVVGWDVNDVTESVRYEYDVEVAFNYNGGSGFHHISDGVVSYKVYDRTVGLSFDWELLNPDELSTTQLTLLLSMLHQYA